MKESGEDSPEALPGADGGRYTGPETRGASVATIVHRRTFYLRHMSRYFLEWGTLLKRYHDGIFMRRAWRHAGFAVAPV